MGVTAFTSCRAVPRRPGLHLAARGVTTNASKIRGQSPSLGATYATSRRTILRMRASSPARIAFCSDTARFERQIGGILRDRIRSPGRFTARGTARPPALHADACRGCDSRRYGIYKEPAVAWGRFATTLPLATKG